MGMPNSQVFSFSFYTFFFLEERGRGSSSVSDTVTSVQVLRKDLSVRDEVQQGKCILNWCEAMNCFCAA